jgi:hypothetical protein
MKQFLQLIRPFREMRNMAFFSFVLFALLAIPMGMRGQSTVTFDATTDITANAQNYQTTELIISAADGSTWKASGYGATANTNIVIGKGGANYLETPMVSGNITSVIVTWSGNTSYYLALQTTGGTELEAKKNPSSSSTATFNVSGTYSQLRLVGRRSSGTSNAAATITKVIVTYSTGSTPMETVATPTFSVAAGSYTSVQTVSIGCETSDATIYYTTDGSTPTTESSVYSSSLTINETTTLKAMAAKSGMNNSAVATATYTITLPYTGDDYVRITDINSLADGDRVILAARYDATETSYYAMTAATTNKPTGVSFTSTTSSNGEILPSSILNSENTYYWTVNVTTNGYTFTNASGNALGYSSSTNFATGGDNTEWTITRATAGTAAMVSGYEGFYITNKNNTGRGIALNNQRNYGPYSTGNNNSNDYNFYLDIFVQGYTPAAVATPIFSLVEGTYYETQSVTISCETPNSVIYYTIDGTEPTNASTLYTGAITVAENTTIKAVAYVGADQSYVATATYTIELPLSTIAQIYAKATEVGNTATTVRVAFGNWVVTGANNSSHAFVSDGTNGFMIYGSGHGFSAGDILSGTVECKVQLYNGAAEITQLTSATSGLTVTPGGTVIVANIDMADLAGINTGDLVSYQNLTCEARVEGDYTNYYLSDGTTEIQAYKTLLDNYAVYLVNGKTYNITGVFVLNNNVKRINPRSAADIVEVEVPHEEYTLTVSDLSHVNLFIFGGEESETIISTEDGETTAQVYDGTEVLISIDVDEGYVFQSLTIIDAAGNPVETQVLTANEYYSFLMPASNVTITATAFIGDNYELFSGALVEGDYLIVYDGSAMNNTVTNDRLQFGEVTASNNVITTDNAAIVWHIAPSGEYWTIYSSDANAYAASTGAKNKAQMLADGTDDKALWTVSGTETYEFVNKKNTDNVVNANLRKNGTYGFACYATTTGGALSLYKKVETVIEEPCGIALDENDEWSENFDDLAIESTERLTGTTMGDCWTWTRLVELPTNYVDTVPQIYNRSAFAHSGNNSLLLWHRGVYAMPELDSTINISELKMSFYVRQSYSFYTLLVGVMTDPTAPETFEAVAYIDNGSSTGVEYAELDFANYQGAGRYIAFKNVRPAGSQYDGNWNDIHSVNYIDDIKLSKIVSDDCSAGIAPGYIENFDNVCSDITVPQTGVEPACWEMVNNDVDIRLDKYPQVYYGESFAESGNYSLRMADRCVYALPALAESVTDITTLQLDMDVFQPSNCYQMQVGVWEEEDSTFVPVATVNNSVTTGYVHFTCNFSHYNGNGRRIAFRNTLNSGARYNYSYNYIDNIELAEIASDNCSAGIVPGQYTEDFDNVCPNITVAQTGMEPDCWEMVQADVELRYDKYPQVYYSTSDSYVNSDHYSLRLADRCVYAMPALAEGYDVKDLTLTMWVAQPQYFYDLTVGVWEENENGGGTFVPVQKVNVSSEGEVVSVDFSNYGEGPGRRIAFRNTLNSGARYNYSYNYIDDIELNVTEAKIAESSSANVIDEIGVERYLEGIVVYPNPTVGELHIGAVDVQKVECYNQMGQLVGVYDNANELNIGNLSNGVYMLRITVPQGVTMRKVVKR